MKQLLIISLLWSISWQTYGQASGIINGEFSQFNGTNQTNSSNCPFFTSAQLTNWGSSHGTPQFFSSGVVRLHGEVDPLSGNQNGEGIFGNFDFVPGTTYVIEIGIDAWQNPPHNGQHGGAPVGQAVISLVNSLPDQPSQAGCASLLPTPSQQIVGVHAQVSTVNQIVPFELSYTVTPVVAYNQIWIHPFGLNHNNNFHVEFDINYVRIKNCTYGTAVFSNGETPWGITAHEHIIAGSTASPAGALVYNNVNAVTHLKGKSITVVPNFVGQVNYAENKKRYLLLEAIPGCYIDPDEPAEAKPGTFAGNDGIRQQIVANSSTGDVKLANERVFSPSSRLSKIFGLYPNPNHGRFSLSLPAECTVKVTDAVGSLVYEAKLSGPEEHTISLDDRLPAGTYIIQIRGKDLNHTERISIIR